MLATLTSAAFLGIYQDGFVKIAYFDPAGGFDLSQA
jgi:hypothetical protein